MRFACSIDSSNVVSAGGDCNDAASDLRMLSHDSMAIRERVRKSCGWDRLGRENSVGRCCDGLMFEKKWYL